MIGLTCKRYCLAFKEIVYRQVCHTRYSDGAGDYNYRFVEVKDDIAIKINTN